MSKSNFTPPEVDALNELMPAFQFVSRLASDECKAVYMVKQKSLDRKAAIKIYSPELSRSPDFRKSFAEKTKVMAKLKHSNLIGVYDSGFENDMLFSVSEFVAGKPLWNSTRGEPVHIKHVRALMEGICEGVAHAHKNEICHGALSLTNVLLNESRVPKIGGFSQAAGDTETLDPAALRFRAPELSQEGAKPTPQTDIYSMGVILREMAVGQTEGEEALAKIEKVGPALRKLCAKATHADPSKRQRSAEQFLDDFLVAFGEKAPGGPAAASGRLLAVGSAAGAGGAKLGKPGAGPVPRPGAGGKPAAMVRPVKPSSPVKIWVHIAIILVLLLAIRMAWNAYQEKKERNQREQQTMSEVTRRVEIVHKPKPKNRWENNSGSSNANNSAQNNFPNDPDPQPVTQPPKEDALKVLARLQFDLSRGSRSEMPEGTVKRGDHYYYHVDTPMTWNNAFWFAVDHGGHLAIPSSKASAIWMREELARGKERSFWIGASKSGAHAWTLADGRPWRPNNASVSLGEYVSVGSAGELQPQQGAVELDFVIQWSLDGSNPGSVESLLEKTQKSLATTAPSYPPGTQAFGIRRYFYVPQSVTWKDAVLSARGSGGHLVVVGGIAEKFNVEKMCKSLSAEEGIWIGGFHLDGKGWRWTTGENWRSSDWPHDKVPASKDAALLIMPGGSWNERSREQKASGYLIEWSSDSKSSR